MSRLIDADLLIEDFEKEIMKCDFDKLSNNDKFIIETSAIALVSFAKRQPIAYDVDEVVEELEENYCKYQKYNAPKNEYEDGFEDGCEYAFVKAIEIVKRGGVNEM